MRASYRTRACADRHPSAEYANSAKVEKDKLVSHTLSLRKCPGRLSTCDCWRFRKFDNRHAVAIDKDGTSIHNLQGFCCMMTGWNTTEERKFFPQLLKEGDIDGEEEEEDGHFG